MFVLSRLNVLNYDFCDIRIGSGLDKVCPRTVSIAKGNVVLRNRQILRLEQCHDSFYKNYNVSHSQTKFL